MAHQDDYRSRMTEARQRLAELLDPKTDQERSVVAWLTERLDLEFLTILAELIEYRLDRPTK